MEPKNRARRACAAAALAGALALLTPAAHAQVSRGVTAQGVAYVDGGVGRAEIEELYGERSRYGLWVVMAARGSGAHLTDVHVRILDRSGRVAFERDLQGPWLLVDLPPGRYEVHAVFGSQMRSSVATLQPGGRRQVVFYFDVADDVPPGP